MLLKAMEVTIPKEGEQDRNTRLYPGKLDFEAETKAYAQSSIWNPNWNPNRKCRWQNCHFQNRKQSEVQVYSFTTTFLWLH